MFAVGKPSLPAPVALRDGAADYERVAEHLRRERHFAERDGAARLRAADRHAVEAVARHDVERPAARGAYLAEYLRRAGAAPAEAEILADDEAADLVFFIYVVREALGREGGEVVRKRYLLHARHAEVGRYQILLARREEQPEIVPVEKLARMSLEGHHAPARPGFGGALRRFAQQARVSEMEAVEGSKRVNHYFKPPDKIMFTSGESSSVPPFFAARHIEKILPDFITTGESGAAPCRTKAA